MPISTTHTKRIGALVLALFTLIAPLAPHASAADGSMPGAEASTRSVDDLLDSTTLLRQGSRGALVADLQQALNDLGFDAGPVDGVFGGLTRSAVRAFQADAGIAVDGLFGTGTRASLASALGDGSGDDGNRGNTDPPADDGTLRPGDRGPAVREAQVALNALGYPAGVSDGIYGSQTARAVRELQKDQGLVVDGKVGANTLATLEELASIPASGDGDQPLIRRGNRGAAVAVAQRLLAAAGFDAGPADGIFGSRTASAAADFQRDRGLTADGVIGPSTWAVLAPHEDDLPAPPADDPDCPPPAGATANHPWRGEPCIERWRPLVRQFFEQADIDTALGVLRCESWGDAGALNPLSDTSGLFQHRPYTFNSLGVRIELWQTRYERAVAWWADRGTTIPAGADIFDPETNVAVAAYLVYREPNAGGWWHWGTFYGTAGCYDWVRDVLAD